MKTASLWQILLIKTWYRRQTLCAIPDWHPAIVQGQARKLQICSNYFDWFYLL